MEENLKRYLFAHNYLIGTPNNDSILASAVLSKMFGIVVVSGETNTSLDTVRDASNFMGKKIPQPFYKGFPESVKEISGLEFIIDQLYSYDKTYGLGMWDEQQHSIFEKEVERIAFNGDYEVKKFSVVTEEEAIKILNEYFDDALASTRPLNSDMLNFIYNCIDEYQFTVKAIAGKDTVISLLLKYKDEQFAQYLHLNDILKVIEKMHVSDYNFKWNKLNLPNQERKFITKLIHKAFKPSMENFERAKVWKGLLHHIHFKPITKEETEFVRQIRDGSGKSAYSFFERTVNTNPSAAAKYLYDKKGSSAILRKLDYILSRCNTFKEVQDVLSYADTDNAIILIQLLLKYNSYVADKIARTFVFHNKNLVKTHTETPIEVSNRKSFLSNIIVNEAKEAVMQRLAEVYKNKLGKVYIDASFKNMALPIFQSTGSYDFGTLPTGSVMQLPTNKKLRLFTYWEKVNDIDLSILGLDESGKQVVEFSWRTFGTHHSAQYYQREFGIIFSGDQTSGYNGGSEYYDIDLELFEHIYPNVKYLIVNNNVYSGVTFDKVICKAGYMVRDKLDSGEVYEPKTVQTAFNIKCASTYAHLFGIDIARKQLVWLDISKESNSIVAATESNAYLLKYFGLTDILNVAKLFELTATEVVDNVEDADVIVSDEPVELKENQIQITSRDQEKIMHIMESELPLT